MAAVSELTGKTIGGYRLERLIGEGAMGPVYHGVHRDSGRQAAVKVIPSGHLASRSLLERYVNDQKLLARQHHPGLVEVYDAGKIADQGVYLVMEHLEGNPLSELLMAAKGGMLVQRALRITEGICAALEAAHEVGVLHRNLKPSNVFVVTQGKRVFVKLLDFGVNGLPPLAGHHDYRAPEQVQSFPINEGADLWSVGAMLYEMLTDNRVSHLQDPPPTPSHSREGLSPALDALVQELLARFPEGRPGSAKRVREACAQLRADLPSESGMLPVVTAPPAADDEPITAATPLEPSEPDPAAELAPGRSPSRPPLAAMDAPLNAPTMPSRPVAVAKATRSLEPVAHAKTATGDQPAVPPPEPAGELPKKIAAWTLGPLALAICVWFWHQPIRHYGQRPEAVSPMSTVKTAKAAAAPFDPSAPLEADDLAAPDDLKDVPSNSADRPPAKKRSRK